MKHFGFLLSIIPVLAYANFEVCDLLSVEQNEANYKIEQVAETNVFDFDVYFEEELTKALDLFEQEASDQEDLFSALEKNARDDELSASLPAPHSEAASQSYLYDQKSEIALQPSLESIPSQVKRPRVVPAIPQSKSSQKKVISKAKEVDAVAPQMGKNSKKSAQPSVKSRHPQKNNTVQKNNIVKRGAAQKRPTIEESQE